MLNIRIYGKGCFLLLSCGARVTTLRQEGYPKYVSKSVCHGVETEHKSCCIVRLPSKWQLFIYNVLYSSAYATIFIICIVRSHPQHHKFTGVLKNSQSQGRAVWPAASELNTHSSWTSSRGRAACERSFSCSTEWLANWGSWVSFQVKRAACYIKKHHQLPGTCVTLKTTVAQMFSCPLVWDPKVHHRVHRARHRPCREPDEFTPHPRNIWV
jgi:hypothetical protein